MAGTKVVTVHSSIPRVWAGETRCDFMTCAVYREGQFHSQRASVGLQCFLADCESGEPPLYSQTLWYRQTNVTVSTRTTS